MAKIDWVSGIGGAVVGGLLVTGLNFVRDVEERERIVSVREALLEIRTEVFDSVKGPIENAVLLEYQMGQGVERMQVQEGRLLEQVGRMQEQEERLKEQEVRVTRYGDQAERVYNALR